MKKIKLMLSMFVVLCFTVSVFAMPNDVKEKFEQGKKCSFEKCGMENDDIMFVLTMFDCPQKENRFGHRPQFFKHCGDNLNLTDEQKTKLKDLKDKEIAAKKEFADKIKTINDELSKENPDKKTIKNMQKQAKKLSQKIIDNYVDNKKQMKEILSAEQYNKMFAKKTKFDMLPEKPNLTDEQKEKMKNLFEQNREKAMSMRKSLFENKIKLENELEKETVDNNIVNNLSNEISKISQDIIKNNIAMKLELKNILTPEQYNKLTQKTKYFKHHHKK